MPDMPDTRKPEEMACRVCATPLNTIGTRYVHPLGHDGGGHAPVPVPAGTLQTIRRSCDFCSDPYPIWTLTGASLTAGIVDRGHGIGQRFGDTWAACASCEMHVAAGRADLVLDRACAAFGIPPGSPSREPVRVLQAAFLAGLQPGRELITGTGWPSTPVPAGQAPKIRDRLRDFYRGPDRLPAPATPAHRERAADSLDAARLYWVDDAFTDLAAQAAAHLPQLAVAADLPPSPHGLLLWSHPADGTVAAASWTTLGRGVLQVVVHRSIGAGLPAPALQRLRDQVGWLAPIRADLLSATGGTGPRDPYRVLITTWLLIAQQVTDDRPAVVEKGIVRAYARAGRPAPQVRLLSIRAPRPSTGPGSTGGGTGQRRPLAARVWVTGHWRNQPYGPGRSLRRPVYIHPFLRGPQDQPITPSSTVRILGSPQPAAGGDPQS